MDEFDSAEHSREYTIDDIVQGVLAALDHAQGLSIYNLGESATTSVAELIEMIGAALGKPPRIDWRPPEPGDVPLTFANVGRARAELGYDPQVPLRDGLARFVAWRRSEPAP